MKILVLPGDGIGPEIMESALKVLDNINENYNSNIDFEINNAKAQDIVNKKISVDELIDEAKNIKLY